MSTFYLIRHATNDFVGKSIAGRTPGVHLNETGRHEAARLAERLKNCGITRIFSSPLERAHETAEPLARTLGLSVTTIENLQEIDFGSWKGRPFSELEGDPMWKQWNSFRVSARTPGGETILQVQARLVGVIRQLWENFPEETMAVVSHGDPLRTVIFYYLGLSLDFFNRVEMSPAHHTILRLEPWGPQIVALNVSPD
jgi:probable phosphomutase (TIGR03848 family)